MFLALKEMRRAKARFGLLILAIGLLVFLVLFQQSLQNGLITGFVGGIRNQSAPLIVYSVDGRRNLQGGAIVPDLEQTVRATDGVAAVGRIGLATFTARAGGEQVDASVVGYDDESLGAPERLASGRFPTAPGEAVANDADAADGFAIGDVVVLDPGGFEITVVGLASDVQINVTPTLWTPYATYEAAVRSRFPDAATVLPNALAVAPTDGVSVAELVDRINAASPDLDALSRADAAAKTPGVSTVRQSFLIIFFLYAGALTLLRAIGAPARRLVASLLVQVVIVIGGGLLVGIALYTPLSGRRLGAISLRFETGAVVFWSVLLMVFGLLSSLFSARRVLAIDPVTATTGAGR